MKKIIIVLCVAIASLANGQNLVGATKSGVYNYLLDHGVEVQRIEEDVVGKSQTPTLSYVKNNIMHSYSFDETGKCWLYSYICKYDILKHVMRELNTHSVKQTENTWINYGKEDYFVELVKDVDMFAVYVTKK
jgi:hypothetical protein